MDTISLQTTQNVKIDYELAGWGDRMLAYVIDSAILYLFIWISFLAIQDNKYFMYIILIPIFVLYSFALEVITNGQSIGKRMLGLKIVKLNSSTIKASDFAIRWCFRFLDFFGSGGLLATLFIGTSRYHQRLGDMLGNTVVIRLNPKNKLQLNDLMRIQTISEYKPKYSNVIRLKESDVVTIKNTLDDFRKYPNDTHANLVDACALKTLEKLGMSDHQEEKHLDFLKLVLKDFVVLTR